MNTAAIPATQLTESQLYDEANALHWARHSGKGRSATQEARLAELEAEFWTRQAKALATAA